LHHRNALELLVATILSAQCTDQRVNQVTPLLFARCPDAKSYAEISQEELESIIRPTGFYRNKARLLRQLGRALLELHGGEVPDSMEALVALPGIGRKTANVVLGTFFRKNLGIVVDTHVSRLSRRLGLTRHTQPEAIERDLMALLPQESWTDWSHRLILHGRAVCRARKPQCGRCVLADLCPSATP
jgi:endonuclease-3